MSADTLTTGFRRPAGRLAEIYAKMLRHPSYRYLLLLLGAPVNAAVFLLYLHRKRQSGIGGRREALRKRLVDEGELARLTEEARGQLERKYAFFNQHATSGRLEQESRELAEERFRERLNRELVQETAGDPAATYAGTYGELAGNPLFLGLSVLFGFPMYLLMGVYSNPYMKYIAERLLMTVFVIFGVAFLVFTILYISPMNPAANIIGETATAEQIAAFNKLYGLDQPYLVQLWNTIRGILTFDLGNSFQGNEQVTAAIANKFPVTLTLTAIATLVSVLIALPVGIISATRSNSFLDYTLMFIALLGLSVPNFWQGLIFILTFAIKLHLLPATFNPGNWLSMIMPIVVLGTGLTAAVARMTRSSILEVIHEDYIITARAKGLSSRQVLWKHAMGNALIPIVTVIGLQFGGMLGGAAVTEKVFNISGIGSYIVDKQFIPDIPGIMGGVVYTAIAISVVNMVIDIVYAMADPRIRSKMRQY
ncbi:MAG: binding-protein-dependent transport system inner rane component [Paenibacillaceae bacterium]|nr:binding-protein-dependent transport system inner rane component [Paenibacillaceae bacterium]